MKQEELRSVPRFPIPREKMKFRFPQGERVFAVRDISRNGIGIGLLEFTDSLLFPKDYRCEGELKLPDGVINLSLRVTRVNGWSVGFVFESADSAFEERIASFLDPIMVARSLRLMDQASAPEAFLRGLSVWYHGEPEMDLYLWESGGVGPQRALFCFGERFWEWREEQGAATGLLERRGPDRLALMRDMTPNPKFLVFVRKVLEEADVLDYRLVSFLKERI
jgi:hypothetical protein